MHRLIKHGLMFGNLVHVTSPVLVERYNRALEHLTGRRTTLDDFHIDIAGSSPEVGEELGDPLYLNHAGVNRQFILLTTEQKTAPLLDAQFSHSRDILHRFIAENEAQLFALTARDAVAGELVNTVFRADTPAKLFDIRRITVEADTTQGTVRDADRLAGMVDDFMTREDAWFDDVLIANMITVAKRTGDVTRNPVRLKEMTFETGNFWTALFGGLYVFRRADDTAVIGRQARDHDMPVEHRFTPDQRNEIATFFEVNGLVEPIVQARGVDAGAILRQKMDFIVIDTAASLGLNIGWADRREVRRLARKVASDLPPEWHGLRALLAYAEEGAPWPKITSAHPAYFYGLRAADTDDAPLVNQLLAELTPKDVRQLFICHKPAFYAAYASWPDEKKAYVADFLAREYQVDKEGVRAQLYGFEPAMDDQPPPAPPAPEPRPRPRRDDLVARVGPWGAVRR
ncbi:DUF6638 family protein [Pseudaestuariivita atlantica]|uniref:Uncharacterized protein n=1 Tax=Pseudaestuariivita atlantica TaxID=1317121 RepID=A0A0L1JQ46_9RHOB|nr:DUF6638 family protein [Pseudaestuariivita atlantica]KNG93842.1 hypothetical protein ATO11_11790 [Pseudaestuariivita atlantica]